MVKCMALLLSTVMALMLLAGCGKAPSASILGEAPVSSLPASSAVARAMGENSLEQLRLDIKDEAIPLVVRLDLTAMAQNHDKRVQVTAAFRADLAALYEGGTPISQDKMPNSYESSLDVETSYMSASLLKLNSDEAGELSGKCILNIRLKKAESMGEYYLLDAGVYGRMVTLLEGNIVDNVAELNGPFVKLQNHLQDGETELLAVDADGLLGMVIFNGTTQKYKLQVYSAQAGTLVSEMLLPDNMTSIDRTSYDGYHLRLNLKTGETVYVNLTSPENSLSVHLPASLKAVYAPPAGSSPYLTGPAFDIDPVTGVGAVCLDDKVVYAVNDSPVSSFSCEGVPTSTVEDTIQNPEFFFAGCQILKNGQYIFTQVMMKTPGGQNDSVSEGICLYDVAAQKAHYIMSVFPPWNGWFEFRDGTTVMNMAADFSTVLEVDFATMTTKAVGPTGFPYGPGTANFEYRSYAEITSTIAASGLEQNLFTINGSDKPLGTVINDLYGTYLLEMTEHYLLAKVVDISGENIYLLKYGG